MIKQYEIKQFKSHKHTALDLAKLTVLCGANGVGKSSVIQSMLLLRESFLKKSEFKYLDLRSNPVTIGTAKDALYLYGQTNEIGFVITTETNNYRFSFDTGDGASLEKTIVYKTQTEEHLIDLDELSKECLFNQNCQYISSARLGPQAIYSKDDVVVDIYNQISVINGQAEHFVHYLQRHREMDVLPMLCNPKNRFSTLIDQVAAWEQEISEGVNIIVNDIGNAGYELNYQFNTASHLGKTNSFKAGNVGFGITYVMPILVAILSAKPGSIIFIENPEAHLHPNGQSRLAELICLAANAGIQLIIETHSDHIINGILVQCKKFEENNGGISNKDVSLYHFDREVTDHCTKATKIEIESAGRIRYTPKGFFDQFTIDRRYLMGF